MKMNNIKRSELDNKFDHVDLMWGTDNFYKSLSNLTPRELNKYVNERSTKERDIFFFLWSYKDLTYAWEMTWAMLLEATDEELKEWEGLTKDDIPENFKPDTKLKDIYPNEITWCPHNNFKIG
jgi:hypothetical protein